MGNKEDKLGKTVKRPRSAIFISGAKTAEDWKSFRPLLLDRKNKEKNRVDWRLAFDDYFHDRLKRRYLDPIKSIQSHGGLQGEGFSIVTIQCSLIEFLETTIQGIRYTVKKPGTWEYSNSRDVFISFLTKREPFCRFFDQPLAQSFYENVRCALVHEARTKGGWRIWAGNSTSTLLDADELTVNRDHFQKAFDDFLDSYREELLVRMPLQEAFLRKIDSLCE